MLRWETPEKIVGVVALFFAGGALSSPPAWFLADLVSWGRQTETRFAAALLSLALMTIGLTGLLYALQYRDYYSEWHAPFPTVTWLFQFVFTTLSALYQFAVLGIRLLYPFGFLALLIASLFLARRRR